MKNMGLVKDVGFKSARRVGSILPQIKIYNLTEYQKINEAKCFLNVLVEKGWQVIFFAVINVRWSFAGLPSR